VLAEKGLAKGVYDELKILGDGELTKKLKVSAHRFSKSAEAKISSAGGTVEKLVAKRPPAERVAEMKAKG
jgi:large subunit ribosomal protein L15